MDIFMWISLLSGTIALPILFWYDSCISQDDREDRLYDEIQFLLKEDMLNEYKFVL